MILKIDTYLKTIEIEDEVTIDAFIREIKRMLPNSWKDYNLNPHTLKVVQPPIATEIQPAFIVTDNPYTYPNDICYFFSY